MFASVWVRLAGAAAIGVLGLTLAAGVTVSTLEERDTFCIACHTLPEVTYYERAQLASRPGEPPADLSSAHYAAPESFRCIDCHRGDGRLVHRATALSLGARDTAIWLTGRADETIEKTEIVAPQLLTGACTKCHLDSLLEVGFNNHFHNRLPEAYRAWRGGAALYPPEGDAPAELAVDPVATSVLCVDCHRAHIHIPGAELQAYLDLSSTVYPACVRCHEDAGHGPLELASRWPG